MPNSLKLIFTSVVLDWTKQHFPEQVLTISGLGAIPLIHLIYLWEHGVNLFRKPCTHNSLTVYLMADYQLVTGPVGRKYITTMVVYNNPTFLIFRSDVLSILNTDIRAAGHSQQLGMFRPDLHT